MGFVVIFVLSTLVINKFNHFIYLPCCFRLSVVFLGFWFCSLVNIGGLVGEIFVGYLICPVVCEIGEQLHLFLNGFAVTLYYTLLN